jgi:hypothetical protein
MPAPANSERRPTRTDSSGFCIADNACFAPETHACPEATLERFEGELVVPAAHINEIPGAHRSTRTCRAAPLPTFTAPRVRPLRSAFSVAEAIGTMQCEPHYLDALCAKSSPAQANLGLPSSSNPSSNVSAERGVADCSGASDAAVCPPDLPECVQKQQAELLPAVEAADGAAPSSKHLHLPVGRKMGHDGAGSLAVLQAGPCLQPARPQHRLCASSPCHAHAVTSIVCGPHAPYPESPPMTPSSADSLAVPQGQQERFSPPAPSSCAPQRKHSSRPATNGSKTPAHRTTQDSPVAWPTQWDKVPCALQQTHSSRPAPIDAKAPAVQTSQHSPVACVAEARGTCVCPGQHCQAEVLSVPDAPVGPAHHSQAEDGLVFNEAVAGPLAPPPVNLPMPAGTQQAAAAEAAPAEAGVSQQPDDCRGLSSLTALSRSVEVQTDAPASTDRLGLCCESQHERSGQFLCGDLCGSCAPAATKQGGLSGSRQPSGWRAGVRFMAAGPRARHLLSDWARRLSSCVGSSSV